MQPVLREDLKIDKLYYIEALTEDALNVRIPNKNIPIMVGVFKRLIPMNVQLTEFWWNAAEFDWFEISTFKNIKNESDANKHIIRDVQLNYMWNFYEVKKFKIQSDMEERAVNLYLQKIIGDPYFKV
jgi:hypothetical protein